MSNSSTAAFKRGIWLRLLTVFAIVCVAIAGITASMTAFADEDDGDTYSFYKVASAAAAYYDDASNAASEHDFEGPTSYEDMGKAATYLGFIDTDYDSGFFGSTVSFLSSSNQSRGYGSFTNEAMQAYVQYGHALSTLGLDSVANESFDIGAIVRIVAGAILFLAWAVAAFVEGIFGAVATILNAFNPFRWFGTAITGIVSWNGTTTDNTPDWLSGIQRVLSTLYENTQELGLIITAVIFLATVGLSLVFWKGTDNIKSSIRKFATRIAFILFAIPVLGVLYTSALNYMAYESENTVIANQVVARYLVDFESWAQYSSLALPSGSAIQVEVDDDTAAGGTVSVSKGTLTQLVQNINRENTEMFGVNNNLGNSTGNSLMDSIWRLVGRTSSSSGTVSAVQNKNAQYAAMSNTILRYMTSTYYHASDYETLYKVRSGIASSDKTSEQKALAESFEDASDISSYQEDGSNGLVDGADYLKVTAKPVTVSKSGNTYTYTGNGADGELFSPIGMYNYLTTQFSDASVVTYSSHKASSMFVVKSHRSVNIVGEGLTGFLYWMSMITTLFGISILAIGYALAMIFNSIGRGIRMIMSLPFAMLGNLRAMAKVVTYGLMMIIEVLGTMLTYSIVIEIYVNLGEIIASIGDVFDTNTGVSSIIVPGMSSAAVASIIAIVTLILGIIINIWFIAKMLKLRKLIVKTLDEYTAGIIDRLFGTQGAGSGVASAPTAGDKARAGARKVGGAVASGAGAMAGMYGTQKAMDALGAKGAAGGIPGIAGGSTGGVNGVNGADGPTPPDGLGGKGDATSADNAGGTTADAGTGGAQGFDGQKAVRGVDAGGNGVDATDTSGNGQGGSSDEAKGKELEGAASLADVSARGVQGESAGQPNTGGSEALAADQREQALKKEQADGAKKTVKGGAKAVAGAVEAGVGAYTGNAQMAKDGAQRAAKGAQEAGQGVKQSGEARKARTENTVNDAIGSAKPTGSGQSGQARGSQGPSTVSRPSMTVQGGTTNVTANNNGVSAEQLAKHEGYMSQLNRAKAQVASGQPATVQGRTFRNTADVQRAINAENSRFSSLGGAQSASTASKAASSAQAASTASKAADAASKLA